MDWGDAPQIQFSENRVFPLLLLFYIASPHQTARPKTANHITMPNQSDDSDQSASMGRSGDDQNEADTSFLDDDFLSFAAENNGGPTSNNPRKRSRSTSPTGGENTSSIPWINGKISSLRTSHHGRGYNSYHEPPALIKLHNEMVSFVKLMEPTREELEARDRMVERVTDLAERTFGKCVSLPLQRSSDVLFC